MLATSKGNLIDFFGYKISVHYHSGKDFAVFLLAENNV